MKKMMNKMIAITMMMAITTAMPAMAGNKKYMNNDKKDKVVTVTNPKKDSHFNKKPVLNTKRTTHFAPHKTHVYRPVVKTCTFKVSRFDSHNKVVAKVERIHGVMNIHWNPRTREVTVRYNAHITSARHIKHAVA